VTLTGQVKRDGYAVGSSGSFYSSTEYINLDECRRDTRRNSTSNVSNVGIRVGGGLVSTGRPRDSMTFCMPFGDGKEKKSWKSGVKKKRSSSVSTELLKTQGNLNSMP